MKKQLLSGLASIALLTACGGSGGERSSHNFNAKQDVNVASMSNGGTATATANAETATYLIDEDPGTAWVSTPDNPIIIQFAEVEEIHKMTLTRLSAQATLGTNADIRIELSSDGVNYTESNMSRIAGGIPCTSLTTNNEEMQCEMEKRATRFVRITSRNGKAYDLVEFEAIANK